MTRSKLIFAAALTGACLSFPQPAFSQNAPAPLTESRADSAKKEQMPKLGILLRGVIEDDSSASAFFSKEASSRLRLDIGHIPIVMRLEVGGLAVFVQPMLNHKGKEATSSSSIPVDFSKLKESYRHARIFAYGDDMADSLPKAINLAEDRRLVELERIHFICGEVEKSALLLFGENPSLIRNNELSLALFTAIEMRNVSQSTPRKEWDFYSPIYNSILQPLLSRFLPYNPDYSTYPKGRYAIFTFEKNPPMAAFEYMDYYCGQNGFVPLCAVKEVGGGFSIYLPGSHNRLFKIAALPSQNDQASKIQEIGEPTSAHSQGDTLFASFSSEVVGVFGITPGGNLELLAPSNPNDGKNPIKINGNSIEVPPAAHDYFPVVYAIDKNGDCHILKYAMPEKKNSGEEKDAESEEPSNEQTKDSRS